MKIILKLIYMGIDFSKQMHRDKVNVYAAQASFFIVISIFPFIMLALSLIQYISPISKYEILNFLINIFPSSISSYIITIVDELYLKSTGTLISITAISTLWAASKSIYALQKGLNNIYHTEESRGEIKLRTMSVIYTIGLIFAFILTLYLLVFGDNIQNFLGINTPFVAGVTSFFISGRTFITAAVLTLFFALIYRFLPDKKMKFMGQLPGAMAATTGWMLFSFFFGFYIDNFSNYSYLYGSLTAIVLLMLWLYSCMTILLLGAELNKFIEKNLQYSDTN